MALPIISADQRRAQRRGVKIVVLGVSGIGETASSNPWRPTPLCSLIWKPVTCRFRIGMATVCDRAPGPSSGSGGLSGRPQPRAARSVTVLAGAL